MYATSPSVRGAPSTNLSERKRDGAKKNEREKEKERCRSMRRFWWEKERQRIKWEGTSRAREIGALWEGYSKGRIDGPGNWKRARPAEVGLASFSCPDCFRRLEFRSKMALVRWYQWSRIFIMFLTSNNFRSNLYIFFSNLLQSDFLCCRRY